jgi:phosphopantothenoylcysteine decarboxylase/phosphopantothenate--cysteine ligase
MQRLLGRHVVVGVTGSIAAYRACDLVRELLAQGATVRVAPTSAAAAFVTPLTFEALSGRPCLTRSVEVEAGKIPHVEEAHRADVVVVAPASADSIAKMAAGFADEAILSVLLSFAGPVVVAPAMESNMWAHPATQANIATLRARGVVVIDPDVGPLASGRSGRGRLAPVARIAEAVLSAATPPTLKGKRVVVSAGPTVEDIDPARTITNRSSGKMGVLVARALALRGATVELVHGPLSTTLPETPGIIRHPVRSAAQMAERCLALVDDGTVDAVVMAAAVADFTPASPALEKLKKKDGPPTITLVPTVDILAALGARADRRYALVGFAAETTAVEAAAQGKRAAKGADVIFGNDVSGADTGFDVDTNRFYIARGEGRASEWTAHASKEVCAERVADEVETLSGGEKSWTESGQRLPTKPML